MMLQVIPDMIPHKIGIIIFPIVILCVTFFWHLLIGTFEKKTVKASTDKERMEANSSARVLCVVGLSQAIMFGIMNYCILYSSCVQENVNGSKVTVEHCKDFLHLMWNYFCCSRKLHDKGKAKYGSWVSNGLEYV